MYEKKELNLVYQSTFICTVYARCTCSISLSSVSNKARSSAFGELKEEKKQKEKKRKKQKYSKRQKIMQSFLLSKKNKNRKNYMQSQYTCLMVSICTYIRYTWTSSRKKCFFFSSSVCVFLVMFAVWSVCTASIIIITNNALRYLCLVFVMPTWWLVFAKSTNYYCDLRAIHNGPIYRMYNSLTYYYTLTHMMLCLCVSVYIAPFVSAAQYVVRIRRIAMDFRFQFLNSSRTKTPARIAHCTHWWIYCTHNRIACSSSSSSNLCRYFLFCIRSRPIADRKSYTADNVEG